ncbi:MAG: hypothetical protein JSV24_05480 [Bacteroidales bacterium]|nr:MAG: hypothetical protein JSV24_05480 [Bacteroidales bacterium]
MVTNKIAAGFSKLTKEEKLKLVSRNVRKPEEFIMEMKSFWHKEKQKIFDDISENTISNYWLPFGIAPNFLINNNIYHVPMVIEESSVVAAASGSAKFWFSRGGFNSRVISTKKTGKVHFIWEGKFNNLIRYMDKLKPAFREKTRHITRNMEKRGGGITDFEFVDMTHEIDNYYQLNVSFETVDSMGANFINSCLEEIALVLRDFFCSCQDFELPERNCSIIMAILSNYTPDCLVESWVECEIGQFNKMDKNLTAHDFIWKFENAVQIANADPSRGATHNKGIFNGIDAVAIATGNDFRAIEANGHTYACMNGKYKSLTEFKFDKDIFRYSLKIPLVMGTVGGLTSLHPLARRSLELLGNPDARKLMQIAASVGLANNFSAVKSLVTKGIQFGHMKMHLLNILNYHQVSENERQTAIEHFKTHKISFNSVSEYINRLRS